MSNFTVVRDYSKLPTGVRGILIRKRLLVSALFMASSGQAEEIFIPLDGKPEVVSPPTLGGMWVLVDLGIFHNPQTNSMHTTPRVYKHPVYGEIRVEKPTVVMGGSGRVWPVVQICASPGSHNEHKVYFLKDRPEGHLTDSTPGALRRKALIEGRNPHMGSEVQGPDTTDLRDTLISLSHTPNWVGVARVCEDRGGSQQGYTPDDSGSSTISLRVSPIGTQTARLDVNMANLP